MVASIIFREFRNTFSNIKSTDTFPFLNPLLFRFKQVLQVKVMFVFPFWSGNMIKSGLNEY